jgi:hypothetical protein
LPRKPTDIVEPKLRIRESLRARLAVEAERHRVSLNSEMVTRLEASLEDKAWNDLATITQDFAAVAQNLRQVNTEMANEWAGLRATQTLMLLVDLLTTKILDHNVRDEFGEALSGDAWVEFSRDLSWPARELQRLRAVIEQRRREEVWPSGGQGQ